MLLIDFLYDQSIARRFWVDLKANLQTDSIH